MHLPRDVGVLMISARLAAMSFSGFVFISWNNLCLNFDVVDGRILQLTDFRKVAES